MSSLITSNSPEWPKLKNTIRNFCYQSDGVHVHALEMLHVTVERTKSLWNTMLNYDPTPEVLLEAITHLHHTNQALRQSLQNYLQSGVLDRSYFFEAMRKEVGTLASLETLYDQLQRRMLCLRLPPAPPSAAGAAAPPTPANAAVGDPTFLQAVLAPALQSRERLQHLLTRRGQEVVEGEGQEEHEREEGEERHGTEDSVAPASAQPSWLPTPEGSSSSSNANPPLEPAGTAGLPAAAPGRARAERRTSELRAFYPRRIVHYTPEQWQARRAFVERCSSIGELLRCLIGDMLPGGAPMTAVQLSACVKERALQVNPRTVPEWVFAFMVPMTRKNRYLFPRGTLYNKRGYYVTQTKAYARKKKCRLILYFRVALILFPDETAYYCTLQRSDAYMAEEAKESPFDFTDSARPFTQQLLGSLCGEATPRPTWALEPLFASPTAVLPDGYVVTLTDREYVHRHSSHRSLCHALVEAVMEVEQERGRDRNAAAMWAEFVQLQPPAMSSGSEVPLYLFDRFFGVQAGCESAVAVEVGPAEGNAWRAGVRLRYGAAPSDVVLVAQATASSKRAAEDLVLRQAGMRHFPEVFLQLAAADPSKVNAITKQYAQSIAAELLSR